MKVEISGWEAGIKKLPFCKYLESDFGFNNKSASDALHALFREGQSIVLTVEPWRAEQVMARLEDLGVQFRIVGE